MNKDKSIKDLKQYNDKIKNQFEYSKIRVWTLERENDKLQHEIQRKDNIINEIKDIINRMIYIGYYTKIGKGTTVVTSFMPVGEHSEFGTRAKCILDRINELKGGENEK